MTRRASLLVAMILSVAAACSDGSPVDPNASTATKNSGTGTDSTGTHTPDTFSQGPLATLRVEPSPFTLPLNHIGGPNAIGYDAAGKSMGPLHATWTSSNPSIVAVQDTGTVYPKAIGSATMTATIGSISAAGQVNVVAAVVVGAPVAEFTLSAYVGAVESGPDTTHIVAVAGAVVNVFRVAGAQGDSLSPNVLVGTATSDAAGLVSFGKLTSGYYRLAVAAPAGSPYQDGSTVFGPPAVADFKVGVTLQRK